ncbi:MAG: 5-oxoprolinase subunit PxpB [Chloroflexi bacterium]|nr:5-oxoprolinase subunit PxpB [Chloroflexota bacterium]
MIFATPRLIPAGDSAILIEWADEIDDAINDRVHACAQLLHDLARPDIRDLIPAYSSLLVCYDPARVAFDEMRAFLETVLQSAPTMNARASRAIEIPTRYGGEFGPDLAFIAQHAGISEDDVIRLHTRVEYRVYLIGFAPGFAYLGSVPEQIAAPRLDTPRPRVPAGSVGIAGRQTGIYPSETPGGWRIIGRTSLTMFDPQRDPPTLLQPGDRVRFVSVT